MVDRWSSRSPITSEDSDNQGRDVNQAAQRQPDQSQPEITQPEGTRFYVREHQRTLPSGRVVT
eukprot:4753017-Amphidinium_carterae.1